MIYLLPLAGVTDSPDYLRKDRCAMDELMNEVELAQTFVSYAKTRDILEALEREIVKQVKFRKSTVKLAGVTATYYKPAEYLDYEKGGRENATPEQIKTFTVTPDAPPPFVAWKELCATFGIQAPIKETKEERVVVK